MPGIMSLSTSISLRKWHDNPAPGSGTGDGSATRWGRCEGEGNVGLNGAGVLPWQNQLEVTESVRVQSHSHSDGRHGSASTMPRERAGELAAGMV